MTIFCVPSILSADPCIGKVDKASLSEQTLMELLIEGITRNKEKLCGSKENPKDISEWKEVDFNASSMVCRIGWFRMGLEGSLSLQYLPTKVRQAVFRENYLTGTVDLTGLPDDLMGLHLQNNAFEGTIDLTNLPGSLEMLFLQRNKFCGKVDFGHLPKSLRMIDLSDTLLEGEYSFDKPTILSGLNYKIKYKRPT